MRIFGLDITRTKAAAAPISSRGWWPWVREPFAGAWQQNQEWSADTVLAYHAVFACVTLIHNDIGKLRPKLVEQDSDSIWSETTNPAFSPVLRRPNRYQNHIQFKQWWITSKLLTGNTYALKQRDNRRVVTSLYLLDPKRVQVLVAPDGSIFYQLGQDNLSGLQESAVQVPASEVIHDRMNCLFHPLIGVSPIYAAGAAANVGLRIESNSSTFFGNGSNPGGVLTAPGAISQETADRLKTHWDTNYGGVNTGKVAVLGDGLKFEPMRMSAVDSQMIEHLRWTAEVVCSTFHVPPYMIGVGTMPTYNNIEALSQQYYSQCLQSLIEEFEAAMDEGLGLEGTRMGVELDLDGLLRMDSSTQMDVLVKGLAGGVLYTDEARAKLDRKAVDGGKVIFRQQQDFPIGILANRGPIDTPVVAPAVEPEPEEPEEVTQARTYMNTRKAADAMRIAALGAH